MTKLLFVIGVGFAVLVALLSCSKKDGIQSNIVGLWEKRIACGFRFPCTHHQAGNGDRLEFMKSGRVNFYENGQITSSKNYKVVRNGDCKMPEEFLFLKYSDRTGIDDAFTLMTDTLTVSNVVCGADGAIITYVRIR